MAGSSSSSSLRQRKTKRDKKNRDASAGPSAEITAPPDHEGEIHTGPRTQTSDDDESAWKVIRSHWAAPLIVITGIFYLFSEARPRITYVVLQQPDLVRQFTGGWINLRPAVRLQDPRTVLIVGTMSSGTTEVASSLTQNLGLEVGHEDSNTNASFVRDGTVSWFHGVRFLERPADNGTMVQSLAALCRNFSENIGFHPHMYRSTAGCDLRQRWSACWFRECLDLVNHEWGCAWRKSEGARAGGGFPAPAACQTPFERNLHQVRHPLRVIESLVTKFCVGNLSGTVQPAFVKFAAALFSQQQHDFTADSCIEAAGFYTVYYNRAMMKAGEANLLQGRFQVEQTSPCEVARLAGFWKTSDNSNNNEIDDDLVPTSLYPPSNEHVTVICQQQDADTLPQRDVAVAHKPMRSTAHQVNKGQLILQYEDLHGGKHGSRRPARDQQLLALVESLTLDLGYALEAIDDEDVPVGDR